MLENALEWVSSNRDWFLSGLGTLFVSVLLAIWVRNKGHSDTMVQKSGSGSMNVQVKGNMIIGEKK